MRPSGVSHAASANPATRTARWPPLRGCGLNRSDICVPGLFAWIRLLRRARRNATEGAQAIGDLRWPKERCPDRARRDYNRILYCGRSSTLREGRDQREVVGMGWRAPVPANEAARLAAVKSYQLLDTGPEIAYDEITELAAQICQCPLAVIGLVDETRDWKKS